MANFKTTTKSTSKKKEASSKEQKIKSRRSLSRGSKHGSPSRKSNSSGDAKKPTPSSLPKGKQHKRRSTGKLPKKLKTPAKVKTEDQTDPKIPVLESNSGLLHLEVDYVNQAGDSYYQDDQMTNNTQNTNGDSEMSIHQTNGNSVSNISNGESFEIVTQADCQPDEPVKSSNSSTETSPKKRGRKKKKKSVVTASTNGKPPLSGRKSKSPTKRASSPAARKSTSPAKRSTSPIKRVTRASSVSPKRKSVSPGRKSKSPSKRASSPVKLSARTTKSIEGSPVRKKSTSKSPRKSQSPVKKSVVSRKSVSPSISKRSPVRASVSPSRSRKSSPASSKSPSKVTRKSVSPVKRKSSVSPRRSTSPVLRKKSVSKSPSRKSTTKKPTSIEPQAKTSAEIIQVVQEQVVAAAKVLETQPDGDEKIADQKQEQVVIIMAKKSPVVSRKSSVSPKRKSTSKSPTVRASTSKSPSVEAKAALDTKRRRSKSPAKMPSFSPVRKPSVPSKTINKSPPNKKARRSSFKTVSDPKLLADSLDGDSRGDSPARSPSPKKVTINPVKLEFQDEYQVPDDKLAMVLRGLNPAFDRYHENFKSERVTVTQLLSGTLSSKDYSDLGISPDHIPSFIEHFNGGSHLDHSYALSDPIDNSTPRLEQNDEIEPDLVPKVLTNTADKIHEISKTIDKTASILKNKPELLAQSEKILPNDQVPISAMKSEIKTIEKEIKNIIENVDIIDDKICADLQTDKLLQEPKRTSSTTQTEEAKTQSQGAQKNDDDGDDAAETTTATPEPLKLEEKLGSNQSDFESEGSSGTLKYIAILGLAAVGSFIAYRALKK